VGLTVATSLWVLFDLAIVGCGMVRPHWLVLALAALTPAIAQSVHWSEGLREPIPVDFLSVPVFVGLLAICCWMGRRIAHPPRTSAALLAVPFGVLG
jgi:hypothetical protein